MCAIMEECQYLRSHNNVNAPIKKGEALDLFESVGRDLSRQHKQLKNIQTILLTGLPLGFTLLGLILK